MQSLSQRLLQLPAPKRPRPRARPSRGWGRTLNRTGQKASYRRQAGNQWSTNEHLDCKGREAGETRYQAR